MNETPLEGQLRPPGQVSRLVAIIGSAATLRLIENYGGLAVKIPTRARPGTQLAKTIGFRNLVALVEALGGNKLNIPLCKAWRVRVLRLRDAMSYGEIARTLHMTESTVYRYLSDASLIGQPRLPGL